MTEEEIKNIKTGDKITITLTAKETNDHMAFVDESGSPFILATSNIHRATLVKPAPVFEAGDTVRIIPDPMTNTVHSGVGTVSIEQGSIGKIIGKMDRVGDFAVEGLNTSWLNREFVSIHCLELVKKAVKDKYYVHDLESIGGVIIAVSTMDGAPVAKYIPTNHPNAKAAAQAECARLNAEWRKQQESQNND